MKVCVQGLWHLGSVTAASLASLGHNIIGLDYDKDTILNLQKGIPPIFEPQLKEIIADCTKKNLLIFTSKPEDISDCEILWIAYDTPVDDDDNADVDFVKQEILKTIPFLKEKAIVLISSQMPVLSIRNLEAIVARSFPNKKIFFACSPENLRLGNAFKVFLSPDRIIVGVRDDETKNRLYHFLSTITDKIEFMSIESAEMTKHAINSFLATSVTFANELATVCEVVGADAKEVERGLKTEQRIGPKAYLAPGGAFAGGTLARDVNFLSNIGSEHNLNIPLLNSIKPSNAFHKDWIKNKLVQKYQILQNMNVTVWGLTYKVGTDTLRRSTSVELCNWLLDNKVNLSVHDPIVKSLPIEWTNKVMRFSDPIASLEKSQILIVGTEWKEYKDIDFEKIAAINPHLVIYDINRFLEKSIKSLQYISVGMS